MFASRHRSGPNEVTPTPAIGVGFGRTAAGTPDFTPLHLDTGQCKTKIRLCLPSLSSFKWSFPCCFEDHLTIRNVSKLDIPQKSKFTGMFSFSSLPPHPIHFTFSPTQMTFIRALTPSYTIHQELMFQYADTGYTFQSGMLHVYFINENSLAVKMCVKYLALKYCICCCLFCPSSIRHLFCTEILIKLFHFSTFFPPWGGKKVFSSFFLS